MKPARLLSFLGVSVLAFAIPFSAGAAVKKEGAWPDIDKKVDFEFDGTPSEGLKTLAKKAGWSLVIANGVAVDGTGGNVHVDVDDQPADAVLEALFVGQEVVAYRNGTLITVTPAETAASAPAAGLSPLPPVPAVEPPLPRAVPAAPVPTMRGEDRNVIGGSLVIKKDEIVHTVTVAGGSLNVEGTITGDVVIAGGSAKILGGGRVVGNATVFGGSLKVERDGRIDGDIGIVGGTLKREEGAVIGGRVVDENHKGHIHVTAGDRGTKTEVAPDEAPARSRIFQVIQEVGQSMTRMALLFVLGCVLLALLAPRMERLRVEIASRPMRSFALGVVGAVVGSIAAAILIVLLCITVVGIPVALVGILLSILAVYGAIASVLTTVGAALFGHRTANPYLHLLFGCALFLVLSFIPWIGGIATFALTMTAVGALIVTRVGGLLDLRRTTPPSGVLW